MKPKFYSVKSFSPYGINNCEILSRNSSELLSIGKNMQVTIEENYEWSPDITIDIVDNFNYEPPEASQYCHVKRITPDIFNQYYTNTLRLLSESFLHEAEYYLQHSSNYCKCYCYTDKQRLIIRIDNSLDNFCCQMYLNRGIKGRNYARKNYEPVQEAQMKQFFNLTLEFLYDPYGSKLLKDEYNKQIHSLIHDGKPIKGLILNADSAFNEIRTQITSRITYVENRLINFDDPKENRSELRGELKGLKYCVKVLDENR